MKFNLWFLSILFLLLLWFPQSAMSQGTDIRTESSAPKHGCSVVDVHCKCTNPNKDFVVENQKLGRSNPGEPGECKRSKEIDASAAQMPIAYCLKGESIKDSRQGTSKCTATWTCKEACEIPTGLR